MKNPAPEDASKASVQGSTGVVTGRGMCEEKRNDDRPAEDGTLNSGRLVSPAVEEIYLQRPNDFQPTEGVAKSHQESDLPIVVRDGNTGHMAKDQAGMQRGQSTHAGGRNTLDESVSRTLSALGTKAGEEPGHRFRGLARLLDRQMLGEAFRKLKRKAAPGIDGVTHAEYAKNLEENLLALESRLKEGNYRAQPVRRRWIAKAGSSKMRPLGIPVLEDKIAQQAVRMILEPNWENDFVDESIGYRPGRGGRKASQELAEALHDGRHRWVVEADIRGFFDHLNHDWLVKMLEQRIADRSLIRIIRKWLKAGVMEELNHWAPSDEGTPQGGIISPLLGNIYLHFVQDCVHGSLGALENPDALRRGETLAACLTSPTPHDMSPSTNRSPIMIEVPPARIPEEPGAVIPHAGICEGGAGRPVSLSSKTSRDTATPISRPVYMLFPTFNLNPVIDARPR